MLMALNKFYFFGYVRVQRKYTNTFLTEDTKYDKHFYAYSKVKYRIASLIQSFLAQSRDTVCTARHI
jgi:hypothetical protein